MNVDSEANLPTLLVHDPQKSAVSFDKQRSESPVAAGTDHFNKVLHDVVQDYSAKVSRMETKIKNKLAKLQAKKEELDSAYREQEKIAHEDRETLKREKKFIDT